MKLITTFIFLLFFCIVQTNAQYLVAGYTSSGGNYIPFQDTILSSIDPIWGSCTSEHYYFDFDLDQDSNPDIEFDLQCYWGGMGSYNNISLTSFNDFSIHVDTNYVEHAQFLDSLGQAHNTSRITPVVRKYNRGDTIFNNQDMLATEEKLLHYSVGYSPSCVYNNINLFFEDTSYIALEKSNLDLYYLKIYVPDASTLELIYAKTNAEISGSNENDILFPNPAKEIINFKKAVDLISVYTVQGTLLIEKNLIDTQKPLDISYLKSGFYIVILKADSKRYITKLLKL